MHAWTLPYSKRPDNSPLFFFRWLMLACIASLIVACNFRFLMIWSDWQLQSSLSCVSREALLLASCMGSLRIDNKSLRLSEYNSHELDSLPTTTIRLRNGSPCTVALGKPASLSPSWTHRSRRRCWRRLLASMSHTSQRTLRGSLLLQRSFLCDSHKRHSNTCHNKKRIWILSSNPLPTCFYF